MIKLYSKINCGLGPYQSSIHVHSFSIVDQADANQELHSHRLIDG